jgi:hypothetical protein
LIGPVSEPATNTRTAVVNVMPDKVLVGSRGPPGGVGSMGGVAATRGERP